MYPLRSLTVIVLLAVLAALAGCSKKDKTEEEPGLTQVEADDLVQVIAAEAATDSGGWLLEVTNTLGNRSISGPGLAVSAMAAPATSDTTFPLGSVTWTFNYTYFNRMGQASDDWSPSAVTVDAITRATGWFTVPNFQGNTGRGTYERKTDLFSMEGLGDTVLTFTNLAVVDSGLFTIQTVNGPRYYLFDNVVGYDLRLPKRLLTNSPDDPYKATGEAIIDAFVGVLRNASLASREKSLDARMVITFDGISDTPLATITANTERATALYRYRINLKTGAIQRS